MKDTEMEKQLRSEAAQLAETKIPDLHQSVRRRLESKRTGEQPAPWAMGYRILAGGCFAALVLGLLTLGRVQVGAPAGERGNASELAEASSFSEAIAGLALSEGELADYGARFIPGSAGMVFLDLEDKVREGIVFLIRDGLVFLDEEEQT